MFIEYIICVFVVPVNAKLWPQNIHTCVVLCMLHPVVDDCWNQEWTNPSDKGCQQMSPSKMPFSMADLDRHLIYCSLGPHEYITKHHLDRFSHFAQLTGASELRQTNTQT